MKFRVFSLFFLISVLIFGTFGCSASPPAPLPAPISQLMTVGNPDASGEVSIVGAEGSVIAGATVTAGVEIPLAGFAWLERWLVGVAWAQVEESSTQADDNGAFVLSLKAETGDNLLLFQSLGAQRSPDVSLKVSGRIVRLPVAPKGMARAHPGMLGVSATEGGQESGNYFALDFSTGIPETSFPLPDAIFPQCSQIASLVVDQEDGLAHAVCLGNEALLNYAVGDGVNGLSPMIQGLPGLGFVGGDPEEDLGVLGLSDPANSVQIFDTSTGQLDCNIPIKNPLADVEHSNTPFALWNDSLIAPDQEILVALSQYVDGTWVVTQIEFTDCFDFTVINQVPLPPGLDPGGMDAFMGGNVVLVTSTADHVVYLVDMMGKSINTIPTGPEPVGVAVRPQVPEALIVNRGDNSLTLLNLMDFTTMSWGIEALAPTDILILESQGLAAVLSTGDNSILTVDLN
ncbi:MAG: hypothetical protein R3257_01160 [bacterium]|nr:hypothetical protein [bacterium]